jgi:hypothetical protein
MKTARSAPALAVSVGVWVLVLVLVWLPLVGRLHDRLTPNESHTGFRFSRNLERPPEKVIVAPLEVLAIRPQTDGRPAHSEPIVADDVREPDAGPLMPRAPGRAPPTR